MEKKLLSLALAVALCLSLAVPAFAADSTWKLEVPGKSDAEIFLGTRTFTLRDWAASDSYADEDYGVIWSTYSKAASRQRTAENVYALSKGNEVVFTKGGESFSRLNIEAWSDPDGDGVYDQRIAAGDAYESSQQYMENPGSVDNHGPILPITGDPVRCANETTTLAFYMMDLEIFGQYGVAPSEYGVYELDFMSCGYLPVTELKMRPDFLLELFGPNTVVKITTPDEDWSCTILVESKPTQPAQPAGVTAAPTNDKLTVNGAAANPTVYKINGSNYFKLRDLGKALHFYVGWNKEQGMLIETDKPYSE